MVKYEGLISKFKVENIEKDEERGLSFNHYSKLNNIFDYEYKTNTMKYDKIVYISLNENKINIDEKEKIKEKDGKNKIELTFKIDKIMKCNQCSQLTCSKCGVCLGKGTKTVVDYQLNLNVLIERIELLRSGRKIKNFVLIINRLGIII